MYYKFNIKKEVAQSESDGEELEPPVVISSDEEVEGGNSEKEEKEEVDDEDDVFRHLCQTIQKNQARIKLSTVDVD